MRGALFVWLGCTNICGMHYELTPTASSKVERSNNYDGKTPTWSALAEEKATADRLASIQLVGKSSGTVRAISHARPRL